MRVVMDPAVRPATAWSREGPKRVGREVAIGREAWEREEKGGEGEKGEGEEEREKGDEDEGWAVAKRKRGRSLSSTLRSRIWSPPPPLPLSSLSVARSVFLPLAQVRCKEDFFPFPSESRVV